MVDGCDGDDWGRLVPDVGFPASLHPETDVTSPKNHIHGDVRDINIMVKKNGGMGFKLVDFDWSGRIGKVRYPIYRGSRLWRPLEAEDGRLSKVDHDIEMLNVLF